MTRSHRSTRAVVLAASMLAAAGCAAPTSSETVGSVSEGVTGTDISKLALANVGKGPCSTNSLGGTSFGSSCTGNGGQPEYWCADFVLWVWRNAGVSDVGGLTAAAGSFYVYGQNHGTLHSKPHLGDAVVFNYAGGGVADHVAVVTQLNADGTIETASGDWGGQSGSEAYFASTAHVVLNAPAYPGVEGTTPSVMGQTISGFVSPVGLTDAGYAAKYVSQSWPLASSSMKMTAGETVAASITLQNVGSKSWDSKTKLATSNPRDRASAFVASDWLSPNRLDAVSGTVAPGGQYKFTFSFHAPTTPGQYHEFFNLVEEGTAWFSDPGQGGPADDVIEAWIEVVAAPPGTDAGTSNDAGTSSDAGTNDDAGTHADAGGGADGGTPDLLSSDTSGASGGCSTSTNRAGGGAVGWLGLALALAAMRRRAR